MLETFKVGDRVEVIGYSSRDELVWELGAVEQVLPGGYDTLYYVRMADDGRAHTCHSDEMRSAITLDQPVDLWRRG